MGFQQVVWGVTLMSFLFCTGCHAQQPACGRSMVNSYNAGVRNATPGSWPWQAALSANGSVFCGGSLITNEWVLTAAYCTARMNINDTMVRLGLQTVSGVNPNEVSRGIVANVCFPAYDPETYDNDICLLKLSAPVNFTDYIRPVCLAAANSTFYSGTRSFIAGFGSTDNFGSNSNVLQQVNIPTFGRRQCECEQPNVTRNMICAGGQASCRGDYGGPLVNSNGPNSSWIQSGILSGDYDCATPRGPGVYTLVSRYQQWIEATVTGMPPGFITFTSRGNDSDLNFTCPTPPPFTTDDPPYPTGSPPYPTTRNPSYSPTGYPPYPTTRNPPYSPTGYPPYPTTRNPPYSPTGYPPYPTSRYPPYYTTRYPPYYTTGYPPYPTSRYPPYYTTRYPPYPTTGYPPYYTTRYPPYPTSRYPPYPTRYPPYYTTRDPPFPPRTPCNDEFCAGAGENLIHFTHFITLSVLALVLHAFVGSS